MMTRYSVEGMTCGSCQGQVEESLLKLGMVKSVAVNLDANFVQIESKQIISIEDLNGALPSKYLLTEEHKQKTDVSEIEQSDLKLLRPLFLILTYIFGASILLQDPWNVGGFMLDFMGLFFIVFSFFKILDLKGFPESFAMYDPLAKVVPVYGVIYPFIELGLGLMFLFRFKLMLAVIASLVILGITTVGVIRTLLDKKAIKCACLGTVLKLPMTKATLIENGIMLIMGVYMLTSI